MLIAFKLKLALACAAGLASPLAVAPLLSDTGSRDATLRDRQAIVELRADQKITTEIYRRLMMDVDAEETRMGGRG